MRVLIRAAFDTFSGYGNDAIDICRYLQRRGVDVTPWPTALLPGLPREFTQLLEKNPTGKHDAIVTFAPPFDICPKDFASLAPVAVGYSMWEKSILIPDDFRGHGWIDDPDTDDEPMPLAAPWLSSPDGGDVLDAMWVTCPMNVACFQAVEPELRYDVVPCGIDSDLWPVTRRDPARRMRFGMIGMLAGRKDPFVMLQAWQELKEEHPEFDAILSLKTSCPGLHPKITEWIPDVELFDRSWPREKVVEWMLGVDVLVSTSRGEGNNKPAMEFMATGGPVIATDWSGHQNWLTDDTGYRLSGTLMPVGTGSAAMEFRADKEHLKALILHTWKERAEVAEKGRKAATFIRQALAWEPVAERMERLLYELIHAAA